jgi:hypothetical protein
MRKSLIALFAAGLLGVSNVAEAASVDILVLNGGSAQPTVAVDNSLGVAIGAINVLVVNATGFTFNSALAGLSLPDSIYSIQPTGQNFDALIANNVPGQAIVADGATAVIGTFHAGDNPNLVSGESGGPYGWLLDATVYDVSLNPIHGQITPIVCDCSGGAGLRLTVPEPSALRLLALGLLARLSAWGRRRAG